MIDFACNSCQKRYSVADAHAGRKMRCKQCSAVVTIPVAEEPVLIAEAAADDADPTPRPLPQPAPPVAAEPAATASPDTPPVRPKHGPFGGKKSPLAARQAPAAGKVGALGGKPAFGGAAKGFVGKKLGGKKLGARATASSSGDAGESGDKVARKPAEAKSSKGLLLWVGIAAAALIATAVTLWAMGVFDSAPAAGPSAKAKSPPAAAVEAKAVPAAGASGDEKMPPADPLAFVPREVALLASIDVARLLSIPWVKVEAENGASSLPGDATDALQRGGFNPMTDLQRVVVAVEAISEEMNPDDLRALMFLQGKFDRKKVIAALQKEQKISAQSEKVGRFDVFEMLDGEASVGRAAFLSEDVVVAGKGDVFARALTLAGDADNVTANAFLKEATANFGSKAAVWAAVELPPELKEKAAQQLESMLQQPVALDGLFLALDAPASGDPIKVELAVQCPSVEDAKKIQGFVGPFIATTRGQLPPPVQELLKGLKLEKPGSKAFRASLEVSRAFIDQAQEMIPAMLQGGAPAELAIPPDAEAIEEAAPEDAPEDAPVMEEEAPAKEDEEAPATEDEEAPAGEETPAEEPAEGSSEEKAPEESVESEEAEEAAE